MTAAWLREWGLVDQPANPTTGRIPKTMAYLVHYVLDMAYIETPILTETSKQIARRRYCTIYQMARAGRGTQEIRVVQRSLTIDWNRIWRNLRVSWVSEDRQSTWYSVIHDIVPTNERLFAMHLVDTASCRQCGRPETLLHRLTECAHGTEIWEWTRRRMAMILRVDPRYIPSDRLLTPYFNFWPPRRLRAIQWILAHIVWYRMQRAATTNTN